MKIGTTLKSGFFTLGKTLALTMMCLALGTVSAWADTIFIDNFNRPDSNTVGNGWSERQNNNNDVAIRNNRLRMRDSRGGVDAQVIQTLSTVGFTNITLRYNWAPLIQSDSSDKFKALWRIGNSGSFSTLATHRLGGSGFSSNTLSLGGTAAGQSVIQLAFRTNVSEGNSGNREGALLNRVVLRGDGAPTITQPEPATILLFGSGLVGLGLWRWKTKKKA